MYALISNERASSFPGSIDPGLIEASWTMRQSTGMAYFRDRSIPASLKRLVILPEPQAGVAFPGSIDPGLIEALRYAHFQQTGTVFPGSIPASLKPMAETSAGA